MKIGETQSLAESWHVNPERGNHVRKRAVIRANDWRTLLF